MSDQGTKNIKHHLNEIDKVLLSLENMSEEIIDPDKFLQNYASGMEMIKKCEASIATVKAEIEKIQETSDEDFIQE